MATNGDPAELIHPNGLAILLGSGLGGACDGIPVLREIPFSNIPGVGASGVDGHDGCVRVCEVQGKHVVFALGRKHYYEGSDEPIDRLLRFIKRMGVTTLLSTSAAGSLTASLAPGDLVAIDAIIDFQFRRPAPHPPLDPLGGQPGKFPHGGTFARDFGTFRRLLDRELRAALERAGKQAGVLVHRGTLAAMAGPCYETRAEVTALERAGADLVTMSAAAEIAFAARLGMRIAALGVVTNWTTGFSQDALSHDDVVSVGHRLGAPLKALLTRFIEMD